MAKLAHGIADDVLTSTVLASAAGTGVLSFETSAPAGPLPLLLPPACEMRVLIPELYDTQEAATVTIAGDDGRPLRSLGWMGPASSWRAVGGRLLLGFAPPGHWRVLARASGGRSWQGDITTTDGATAEVVLD